MFRLDYGDNRDKREKLDAKSMKKISPTITTNIDKMKITSKSRDPCHELLLTGSTAVTRALESADTDNIARPFGENSMDVTKIICARFNF
jgi:hypothetical protein